MMTGLIITCMLAAVSVDPVLVLEPGPGNPRNSEGDFLAIDEQQVVFIYTHFTGGGGDDAKAHLAARWSKDAGATWTQEDQLILDNEGQQNIMSVSLEKLKDGAISLFYLRKDSDNTCILYLRRSTDGAKTWSEPVRCIPSDGYYVVNNDRVVPLSTGRLIAPAALNKGGRYASLCFFSDDNGASWQTGKTELPPPEGSKTGLQEPGVIELRDGRLMMLCRTDQGCQLRSYSSDGGDTWSPVEKTDILSPVSPATVERLPNGSLMLIWNDHDGIDPALKHKRTPLTIALSADEGQTWTHKRVIEDNPDGWYCYTAMECVGDWVLLGYCAGDTQVGGLNRLKVVRLPLAEFRP